ncbi:MAG: hypothetical protein ACETWT_01330, partial [Thermodesulfobacteriota bacterium]
GAQILRNEAYLQYAPMTKDVAQRSPSALLRAVSMSNGSSTFYEAINFRMVENRLLSSEERPFQTSQSLELPEYPLLVSMPMM